jgi:hypothetical protein
MLQPSTCWTWQLQVRVRGEAGRRGNTSFRSFTKILAGSGVTRRLARSKPITNHLTRDPSRLAIIHRLVDLKCQTSWLHAPRTFPELLHISTPHVSRHNRRSADYCDRSRTSSLSYIKPSTPPTQVHHQDEATQPQTHICNRYVHLSHTFHTALSSQQPRPNEPFRSTRQQCPSSRATPRSWRPCSASSTTTSATPSATSPPRSDPSAPLGLDST